jgi:hypothetical protein
MATPMLKIHPVKNAADDSGAVPRARAIRVTSAGQEGKDGIDVQSAQKEELLKPVSDLKSMDTHQVTSNPVGLIPYEGVKGKRSGPKQRAQSSIKRLDDDESSVLSTQSTNFDWCKPMYVSFGCDPATVDYARLILRRELIYDKSVMINKHGCAAAERQAGIEHALHYMDKIPCRATRNIYEVGAHALRTLQIAKTISVNLPFHFSMPRNVPKDNGRFAAARDANIGNFCRCNLEECPHVGESDFRALLLVHVVYYLNPLVLANAILVSNAKCAVSVEHNFDDASGTLCNGTLRYYVGSDGNIKSTAVGENEEYNHPPCHWRYGCGVTISDASSDSIGTQLIRYEIARFGDTSVVVYELQEGNPKPVALRDATFDIALSNDPHLNVEDTQMTTILNRQSVTPNYDVITAPVKAVFYIGGLYVITKENKSIVAIPKGLIGALATMAAGQPRDAALYQKLLSRAKQTVRAMNMPDIIAADAVVYASVAAMARVDNETIAVGRTVNIFSNLWAKHAQVLALQPIKSIPLNKTTALYVASCLPSLYLSGVLTTAPHYVAVGFLGTLAHPLLCATAAPLLAYGGYKYWSNGRGHLSDEATRWAQIRNEEGISGPTSGTIHFPVAQYFKGWLKPKALNPPLHPKASINVQNVPDFKRWDASDRLMLRLQGVGFTTATPSAIPQSEEAAISALKNRILLDTGLDPDTKDWERVLARMDDPNTIVGRAIIPDFKMPSIEDIWDEWVVRFPISQQKKLNAAREELKVRDVLPMDCKLEVIVKREKTGVSTIDGISCNNPRAVCCLKDTACAVIGPESYAYAKAFIEEFDVTLDAVACCAIRCSAEQLGMWIDKWTNHFRVKPGGVVYGSGDQEKFDIHQGKGAFTANFKRFEKNGFSLRYCNTYRAVSFPNGAIQGLTYIRFKKKSFIKVSGTGDTTQGNCFITLAAIEDTFGPVGPDTYVVVVLGDDFFLIGRADVLNITEKEFRQRHALLGLAATYKATRDLADHEFVSLVFYPTDDGTIPGPKIGRNLLRGGWTTSSEKADIYGAAVSMQNSVSHIPFLKEFFDVHRRLSKPSGEYREYHRLAVTSHKTSPATWEFIERRYGLTTADYDDFCHKLGTVNSLPACINWPDINHLVDVDA